MEFPLSCPLPPVMPLGTTGNSLSLSSLLPPSDVAHSDDFPTETYLLQVEQSQLSQPSIDVSLSPSMVVPLSPLHWKVQNWKHHSSGGLTVVEQRGRVILIC